ncbi:alpha/beta hydrolase [Arthrobacter sp. NPDC080031]|uniref:alpha/beta fold hydrolase n=1 Tax=Arthrobacter sp. NPDC080031 TaxID=3155918 RepID=UPI00344F3575
MNSKPTLAPPEQLANLPQTEGLARNGDVNIHYRTYGSGPALVLQHGFPDNEFGWWNQILDLARDHLVITPTLRGYPPSSVPENVGRYMIPELATDIGAVLDHLGLEKAVLVGHDWGGVILQAFALFNSDRVTGLAFLNTPVLQPFIHHVNHDVHQQELSDYTIAYQRFQEGDEKNIEYITRFIRDPQRRQDVTEYLEASPMHGMLAYYKMGYPRPPYGAPDPEDVSSFVYQVPSLILWGLEDPYFDAAHLNNLWNWFTLSYRFVSIPGAGHWVHQDAPGKVNAELRSWLRDLNEPPFVTTPNPEGPTL